MYLLLETRKGSIECLQRSSVKRRTPAFICAKSQSPLLPLNPGIRPLLFCPSHPSMPWRTGRGQRRTACGPRNGPVCYLVSRTCSTVSPEFHPRTCFLRRITLKRSKSVSCLRLTERSRFLAQALLFHLLSTESFSQRALRAVWPAARGSFSITMGVKERSEREAEWRGTAALGSEEGPSTRTYFIHCQPCALADRLFVLCASCDMCGCGVCGVRKCVLCESVYSMSVDFRMSVGGVHVRACGR